VADCSSLARDSLLGLAACTTTEGTNAFSDIGTFEREVMSETLRGMACCSSASRRMRTSIRAARSCCPNPTPIFRRRHEKTDTAEARCRSIRQQGADRRDRNLSEADIAPAQGARGRPLRIVDGRPLTEEARQDHPQDEGGKASPGARPLYLPPEEYFTTVKGQDIVCLAKMANWCRSTTSRARRRSTRLLARRRTDHSKDALTGFSGEGRSRRSNIDV
jgi:hypothetical protein